MNFEKATNFPRDDVPEIILIGLSHKSAPVEVREKFLIASDLLPEFMHSVKCAGIREIVYLSTCNRVSIYFTSSDVAGATEEMMRLIEEYTGLQKNEFKNHIYRKYSRDAVVHLFSVASSLDSMVIGENEILGQVKEAYRFAVQQGKTGILMNRLFHQAFNTAKKIRTETAISENPLSIAFIATEQAKKILGDLSDKKALLVGAGEMGELILRYLTKNSIGDLTIANRSLHNAECIVDEVNKEAHIVTLNDIEQASVDVDIIISSTASPGYIFPKERVAGIQESREGRPLFLIDISVPRNIDPCVNDIEGVHLYNIDDLKHIADENLKNRMNEVILAEQIINADATEFFEWYEGLEMVPMLIKVQQNFDEIRINELKKYRRRKMKHFSDEDFTIVMDLTKQIMTKTLHKPIMALKRYQELKNSGNNGEHLVDIESVIEELFD